MARGFTHPPELKARARELFVEIGNSDRVGERLAAEGTPVPRGTLYCWLYDVKPSRERSRKEELPKDARDSLTEERVGGDLWSLDSTNKRIKTVDELLAHCRVDTDEWEVERSTVSSHEVTYVPRATRTVYEDEHKRPVGWVRPTTKAVTVTMFRVKATLKRRAEAQIARRAVAAMVEQALEGIAVDRGPHVRVAPAASGMMLELAIVDHHFNKLVWGRETGGPDYDLKLAAETYRRATEALLDRSAQHRYERVVVPIGHDLFNADNQEGTTTGGTRQDNDTRLLKVVDTVLRELVWSTDLIVDVTGAPVDLVLVPGNHDELLSALVVKMLKCWYRSDPNVQVDDGPALTKYRQWGQTMLAFNHGDKVKWDRLARLMASDHPTMWAQTRFREVHVGHGHVEGLSEYDGVKVRGLPSLTATDYWHAGQGYRNTLRQAQAFHWSQTDGLVGTAVYTHPAA